MTNQERFNKLVPLFETAIVDKLKEQNGETYVASSAGAKRAAFAAIAEVIDSEAEPVHPMLAVAIWEAVMHVNDSALHQSLERQQKVGTLPFKIVRTKRSVDSLALKYM